MTFAPVSLQSRGMLPVSLVERGYRLRIARARDDRDWDAFLAAIPGGHYAQTAAWAEAKSVLDWRSLRVVMTREGRIVAGAQMLISPLPVVGAVGFVPKGPVSDPGENDVELAEIIIGRLHRAARAERVRYLALQPPNDGENVSRHLPDWGLQPSSRTALPTATILLDLSASLDEILAGMRSKTRYNVRLSQRKGVTVREGSEDDLPAFCRVLESTGRRQQFSNYPESYYRSVWRILGAERPLKLFVAECEGEVVSALLAIPFGDTVTYWRGGWTGRHGNRHPNEAMHWAAIRWARSQGYRHYDFEGIDPELARLALEERPIPDDLKRSPSYFKLGFGGSVTLFPQLYDCVYNPVLRWGYTTVVPRLSGSGAARRIEAIVRGLRQSP